jgi:hypothetical protein
VLLNKTNLAIFVQVYCKEQTQFGDSYATNWPVNLQVNDLQTTTHLNIDCWTWLKNMSVAIEINRSRIGSHHKFTQGIYILESNVDDVLFKSILLAMS